ncbi:hypothetical protein SVIOM74S_00080 [Streptomyces violarus]
MGAILLFPPLVLARLMDPLLGRLNAALVRYEGQRLASSPVLRLRASVHVGPLSLPDHRGNAINDTTRRIPRASVQVNGVTEDGKSSMTESSHLQVFRNKPCVMSCLRSYRE